MNKLSILYIVLAGVSWGTAGIFVNNLSPYGFSSVQMTSMRNIVAAIVMVSYILIKNPSQLKAPLKEIGLFMISGILVFATGSFYYMTMQLTTQSTAVVLMYAAPILVTIVSVLFMGEKLTRKKVFAITLNFVGCGLVAGIIGGMKFSAAGIVTGILSAVCYGLYNLFSKIEMRRGNDALTATAYCFLMAAVLGLCIGRPVDIVKTISTDALKILPFAIGIGLFTGALPYFLYNLASKKLPVGIASALSSIEPLTAAIISFTLYREPMSFQSVAGIIALFAAVIILSRSE